ncbi:Crp/Fnr family transcriptional regulator [Vibrio bivalvicida]|uniref:Crp/Fnr family transcriptional regulator n=1 Tax=Vibrio bivalvicida TaxID=1276888 RepID=A0ABV4MI55_9VIBR
MSSMHEYDIVWPTNISENLKARLIEIAIPIDSIEQFKLNPDYWSVEGLYYIQSGLMTVGYTAEDLNTTISAILGPHDWIGANTLFSEKELLFRSFTLTPVKMLFFPRAKMEILVSQEPEIYKLLFHILRHISPHWIKSALVCMHERRRRLAFSILMIFTKQNEYEGTTNPELLVSQQQLSSIVGISRPRVNETLKEFEELGFISVQRGRITIKEVDGLKECLEDLFVLFNLG